MTNNDNFDAQLEQTYNSALEALVGRLMYSAEPWSVIVVQPIGDDNIRFSMFGSRNGGSKDDFGYLASLAAGGMYHLMSTDSDEVIDNTPDELLDAVNSLVENETAFNPGDQLNPNTPTQGNA